MTTPTANPVPSTAPQDLLFNAEKLDELINGLGLTFVDRLGEVRRTAAGAMAELNAGVDSVSAMVPSAQTSIEANVGITAAAQAAVIAQLAAMLGDITLPDDLDAAMIAFDGGSVQNDLVGRLMEKAIELAGVQPAAIVPRLGGVGAGAFTFGALLQVDTFANSPGILGGLNGSLSLRFDTQGRVKVSQTAVVDLATTNNAAAVGGRAFVMLSRDGAGNNVLSINGEAGVGFVNSTNFYGDAAFLGSPNGIDAVLQGSIAMAFLCMQPLSVGDAKVIMSRGLSSAQLKNCVFAMGDTHGGSDLVVPPASGSGENFPALIKPTVVLPVSGRIRNFPRKRALVTNTPRISPGYFIGDSQTWQFNASGSPIYTDTGSVRLKDEYSWVWKYAKGNNRDIQINNFAVTGSGFTHGLTADIAYSETAPAWNPHLAQMGRIPPEWYGQIVMVPGWNNLSEVALSIDAARNFRRAIEALIAKGLLRYYGGLGVNGLYGNNYGGGAPIQGWSCTGTSGDITADDFGTPIHYTSNPFPCYGTGDNDKIRKVILAPGQFVEWDVLAIGRNGRYATFTQAQQSGGAFEVRLDGVAVVADTTLTSQPGLWDQVNWIENPVPGQKMRVQNTGTGTVTFMACAFDNPDDLSYLDRQVIVCTTTGNLTGRTAYNLQIAARMAEMAAMTFGDMGVKFCNLAMGWQSGDQDAQDPAHISPQGTDRLADTIPTARGVPHFLPTWCYRVGG